MSNPTNSIRTNKGSYKGERLKVRSFKTSEEMHKFLNTGNNSLDWRECDSDKGDPTKRGTYAYAGQAWHNVKSLDSSILAHI